MKAKFLFLIVLFTIFQVQSQIVNTDTNYYQEFRKNEEPKASTFEILASKPNEILTNFYVIHKVDESGNSYYFKVDFNNDSMIITASFSETEGNISEEKLSKLKNIAKELMKKYDDIATNSAARNCNRANDCYGKSDNELVMVCAINCMLDF